MKRKSIYTILALFVVVASVAQQSKQITIDLSPVVIERGNYYFNGQRVTFDAMMIPLISLQDDKINKKLKVMNTTKDVFKFAVAITSTYFLIQSVSANQQSQSTYQLNKGLIWGTIGVITIQAITIPILKRGIINRYNEVVVQPTAQFSPSGFGAGFVIKF
jgi:hypothetical protein